MTKLPQMRRSEIVVQELESEILIYDLKINKAFALNKTASTVYLACDGKTSFDELKIKSQFTNEIIYLTLDALKKDNLLESDSYISPFTGMNRREVIRKVGLSTLVALPVISSLVAPHSIQAASGGTCPSGLNPADPVGSQGFGNTCGCGTFVGIGNTCGRGTTGSIPSTCRAGCLCRATNCSPITNTCVGLCE
ncbi:MAG: hypothetical protein K1X72_26555 [Pyrinomonadaceae bacterium]|nr:hypothetical protein [Pyrinomonadaceae bacterium]